VITSRLGEIPELLTIQGRDGPIGLSKGEALTVLTRWPLGLTNNEERITRVRHPTRTIKKLIPADRACCDDKQQDQKLDKLPLTTFLGHA
jgi:hypothetical protein